jgi:hypothetical protein
VISSMTGTTTCDPKGESWLDQPYNPYVLNRARINQIGEITSFAKRLSTTDFITISCSFPLTLPLNRIVSQNPSYKQSTSKYN